MDPEFNFFSKLSLVFLFFFVLRVVIFLVLRVVKKQAPADRAVLLRLMIFGPPLIMHIDRMHMANNHLIHWNGETGYWSIVLTFWTYSLCKIGIVWAGLGYILILSRYLLYWYGYYGGIWSPLVKYSGYAFQFWVRVFPFVMGGMFDIGPLLGVQIHKRAMNYFRNVIWCPYPPGIFNYDEIENKFNVNFQLLDNFDLVLRYFMPYSLTFAKDSLVNRVYLPYPDNFTDYKCGFLFQYDSSPYRRAAKDFFQILNTLPTDITIGQLNKYFFDFNFNNF